MVPAVALLIGLWMLLGHFRSGNATAKVYFETAEEIFAGKTEVRCRSVRVGIVKSVELSKNLKSVVVHLEIDENSRHLLRKGARFWVVKPRISGASVTGITTLIQGSYIELDPSLEGVKSATEFVGLEVPPATSMAVPGRRVVLTTGEAGILAEGSAVYHRGFEVGRIETRRLAEDGKSVKYDAFIKEKFSSLITTDTRFWNTNGVDISAGADGFKIRTPSLQAMVSGGVSFGNMKSVGPREMVEDGHEFVLYDDEASANSATFVPTRKVLLLFDQTVRGLAKRAPVEFRGIVVGRVLDISFELVAERENPSVPVLIELDTRMMHPKLGDRPSEAQEEAYFEEAVHDGLRASLKVASLITGALYVDLDYYPDKGPAAVGKSGEHLTLPTVSSGIAQFEAKLTAVLDKLQALPLEESLESLTTAAKEAEITIIQSRETMDELKSVVSKTKEILADPTIRNLPLDLHRSLESMNSTLESLGPAGAVQGDLLRSLDELRAALRSARQFAGSLDENPNSLLFGRKSSGNPTPKAPRR